MSLRLIILLKVIAVLKVAMGVSLVALVITAMIAPGALS